MIGQKLNKRYAITASLGKGGMGTVYRATDAQSMQEVALKVISSELTVDNAMLERFKREGEALRKLKHPNIVGFMDAFQHREHYVIVMEYVPGGSLHEVIKKGPLPVERARSIALELCDALIRSHHLDIIHRDIKPENVLIDQDGAPKLADFGVARLSAGTRMTRTGTQVGTPYYMAPEAWEGKDLDARADIWSLGVVLFEMLSGQVPFDGETAPVVMTKVLTSLPPDLNKLRADAPYGLVKIITRMLMRDKAQRYQTMREVAVDLERGTPLLTPAEREALEKTRLVEENERPMVVDPESMARQVAEKAVDEKAIQEIVEHAASEKAEQESVAREKTNHESDEKIQRDGIKNRPEVRTPNQQSSRPSSRGTIFLTFGFFGVIAFIAIIAIIGTWLLLKNGLPSALSLFSTPTPSFQAFISKTPTDQVPVSKTQVLISKTPTESQLLFNSGIITRVIMARDVRGSAKEPVDPTTVFNPTSVIHAVIQITDAPVDTKFTAEFYVVDVGSAADPNSFIGSSDVTADGSRNIDFTLTPTTTWPAGSYRVDIKVNGQLDQSVPYTVQ